MVSDESTVASSHICNKQHFVDYYSVKITKKEIKVTK